MAESAIDRLKRIAAEKKAAKLTAKTEEPSNDSSNVVASGSSTTVGDSADSGKLQQAEPVSESSNSPVETVPETAQELCTESGTELATAGASDSASDVVPTTSVVNPEHPLAMKLAELEDALLEELPEFRVIMRALHKQLLQDSELVTALRDEEIGLMLQALKLHANTEIVEPAKAKAIKSAATKMKKQAITEDDL